MDKYRNKYRIASTCAQWWDYGWNAAYFITICSQNRECRFGKIENKNMELSRPGIIAETLWHEIRNHFPFVDLGDFVVMPNHIHGILIVDKSDNVNPIANANVETRLIASLQSPGRTPEPPKTGGFARNKNPMLNDNISRVVRWFKGRCSFEIRKINDDFAWQPPFS